MTNSDTKINLAELQKKEISEKFSDLYTKYFQANKNAIYRGSDESFVIYSPFDYSISQKITNKTAAQ